MPSERHSWKDEPPEKPKLMDRLILLFWSGGGGIRIMNRLILAFWILLALTSIAVVSAVVGGHRQGIEARNRNRIVTDVFQTVCTSLPEIESSRKTIPVERLTTAVRKATKQDPPGTFWLCRPEEDDDPLVVYSGPLTDPYVRVLFRFGGTTSWSKGDWENCRARKDAINLNDLPVDH